jgi:addiction module RelE/StbE family toxin
MKAVYQTRQFKKDLKRIVKRGKEIEKLKVVIRKLVEGIELDER